MTTLAILGVGTGVGKTHVAAELLRAAHAVSPLRIAPFKPLESGVDAFEGVPQDALALLQASGLALPLTAVCPWPLPRPVAPAEELERCGIELRIEDLVSAAAELTLQAGTSSLLFEGAGGVLSPLSWTFHALDVCAALQAGIWLVARDELGAISHVLTAVEVLRQRSLPLQGVILNRFAGETSVEAGSNQNALRRLGIEDVWLASEQGLEEAIVLRSLRWFESGAEHVGRR